MNDLVKTQTQQLERYAFEPRTIEELRERAKGILASGLAPSGYKTEAALIAVWLLGRDLGLSTMQSLYGFHPVEGRPTIGAHLMHALCKQSPACEYFILIESSPTVATYETKRKGDPQPTHMSYTIEEAIKAGATSKPNWSKHPRQMLMARCIAILARSVYPDVIGGLYLADEIEDVPKTYVDTSRIQMATQSLPQMTARTDGDGVAVTEHVRARTEAATVINSPAPETIDVTPEAIAVVGEMIANPKPSTADKIKAKIAKQVSE